MANRELKFYYQNVRGLKTKTEVMKENVSSEINDVYLITESWLNEKIGIRELFDKRYAVFRLDRHLAGTNKKDGGGVIVAFKKRKIRGERILGRKFFSGLRRRGCAFEDMWVELYDKQQEETFFIGLVYFPPNSVQRDYDAFLAKVRFMCQDGRKVVVAGDFNRPKFAGKVMDATGDSRSIDQKICNEFHRRLMEQINHLQNRFGRLLDLSVFEQK